MFGLTTSLTHTTVINVSTFLRVERQLARRNLSGLTRLLRNRDALVRRRAAQALGELGAPAAIPHLERALNKDPDQYVQRYAIDSLYQIGDEAAIRALVRIVFGAVRTHTESAAHALRTSPHRYAQAALEVRDMLTRNDWDALQSTDAERLRPLEVIMQSEQYARWHSAKRREILRIAVQKGIQPARAHRDELAGMGLFVRGVHTVGDLVKALRSSNTRVRIAAATRLGNAGVRWTTRPLYRHLKREANATGDSDVIVALARALLQLGDQRVITFYKRRLREGDGRVAANAARTLAAISTPTAIRTLFWFVVKPPPPPGYRNVPLVRSALEAAGPAAIDALRPLAEYGDSRVRTLLIEIIPQSGHLEAALILADLARDEDDDVSRHALEALALLNSAESVGVLCELTDDVSREWIARALVSMTHPDAPSALRALDPVITTVDGILKDGDALVANVRVQVVQRHYFGEREGWGWRAVSPMARTNPEGRFAFSLFGLGDEGDIRLKVNTLVGTDGTGGETFMADIPLLRGEENPVSARIDRYFDRLVVEVRFVPASSEQPPPSE